MTDLSMPAGALAEPTPGDRRTLLQRASSRLHRLLRTDPFRPVPVNDLQQEIRQLTLRQGRLRIVMFWAIIVWSFVLGWTIHFTIWG